MKLPLSRVGLAHPLISPWWAEPTLRSRRRPALTRTEVLFLIAFAALAFALLFPYVYRQRLMQRRLWCEKRQIEVSKAILGYEDVAHHFPGFRNLQAESALGSNQSTGWVFPILPYLGREADRANPATYEDLFAAHGPDGPDATRGQPPDAFLMELVCPDHRPASASDRSNWLGWVVNSGLPDVQNDKGIPPDWPANGVFLDYVSRKPAADYQVSLEYVNKHDGAEHTLLLSENIDAGRWTDFEEPKVAFVWVANLVNGEPSPQGALFRINRRRGEGDGTVQFARPSSYHRGGVNVVFCDGSTQFLSETMDYTLFCRLMTPNGASVKMAGSEEPVPAAYRQGISPQREDKKEPGEIK